MAARADRDRVELPDPPAERAADPDLVPTDAGAADRDGVWLSWRSYGDPAAPPVLLVIGFLARGKAWHRLVPPIVDAGFRAVTFDNRGTGDSDRPGGLWTIEELALDAAAVMDAAGVERAHVVGASMGGMVAQRLALDHAERVRSLVLFCTSAGGVGLPSSRRLALGMLLRPFLKPEVSFRLFAPVLYAERTLREHPDRLEEDHRIRYDGGTPLSTVPAQAAAIFRHDVRDRIGEIDCPVLIMHGEEDSLIRREAALELAELIPHAELEMLPDCGHVVTTDANERVPRLVVDFLRRCD